MKWQLCVFSLCICTTLTVPFVAAASVVINEIAWMGTEMSANDEWIELYNTGTTAVSVDGWVLTDNTSLDIVLSGTIAAGEYAVLERTDDTSAPSSAFLIYTGALANEGRTLTLLDASGGIADQVAGGEGWEALGGDNVTKDTAQRTGSGWVTAVPTPGRTNSTTATPPPDEAAAPSSKSGARTSSKESDARKRVEHISLTLPDTELVLSTQVPEIGFVNQEINMDVAASGIGTSLIHSLTYQWNFGDAQTARGKQVAHHYLYPGEYVIVVRAGYGRHEAAARHTITILPRTLSLTRTDAGVVHVHNDAPYEIDISGYRLKGSDAVVFPSDTIMLPGGTITVSEAALGKQHVHMVGLYDTQNTMVAYHVPAEVRSNDHTTETEDVITHVPATKVAPVARAHILEVTGGDGNTTQNATSPPEVPPPALPSTSTQSGLSAAAYGSMERSGSTNPIPYLGLFAVLFIGLITIFTSGKHS